MTHRFGRMSLGLAVVAVLLAGAPPVFAQQSSGGQEGFGVQVIGGPLFANLVDAEGFTTSQKTGWLVGLGLGGNRGGNVGVEADVLYGQRKIEESSTFGTFDLDQHVVDVPVMLKVNIGSSSRNGASGFVQAGGFIDWLFNSKLQDVDVSSDTDGFQAGVVFGGGVEFLRFSVQGRYYRGLRDINQKFDLAHSGSSKSQAIAILFGFRLN